MTQKSLGLEPFNKLCDQAYGGKGHCKDIYIYVCIYDTYIYIPTIYIYNCKALGLMVLVFPAGLRLRQRFGLLAIEICRAGSQVQAKGIVEIRALVQEQFHSLSDHHAKALMF